MKPTFATLLRMTDAAFKRHLKTLPGTWLDRYRLETKRRDALLRAKARRFKRALYIISPNEHGNGGWCGQSVHDVVSARTVLTLDPVALYFRGYYEPQGGSMIRACRGRNVNRAVYLFDHENGRWLNRHGHPVTRATR